MRISIFLNHDGTSKVEYPAEDGMKVAVTVKQLVSGVGIAVDADYPNVVTCDKGMKLLERMVSMMGMCMTTAGDNAWRADAIKYLDEKKGSFLVRLREDV